MGSGPAAGGAASAGLMLGGDVYSGGIGGSAASGVDARRSSGCIAMVPVFPQPPSGNPGSRNPGSIPIGPQI
jgi:hypothetical protein